MSNQNFNQLLPKDKEDMDFVENLLATKIEQIPKETLRELLKWTQDINWPQSKVIIPYIRPHINIIDEELIDIINGQDSEWKNSILWGVILNSLIIPNKHILIAIENLLINPSHSDIEYEVNIIAQKILTQFKNS